MPEPDELEAGIEALDTWVSEIIKRRNQVSRGLRGEV